LQAVLAPLHHSRLLSLQPYGQTDKVCLLLPGLDRESNPGSPGDFSQDIEVKIKDDTLHWSAYLTPSVWRMAALPMIAEEIVSEVLVVFEFFHFMLALLMEVVSMF
jgi:hypothetical protein